MIKRGRLPPSLLHLLQPLLTPLPPPFFLIYRGEKNVHALVLLIRELLLDVVAFIGLEMPISHSATNLWSENTHLVTHLPENQVQRKTKHYQNYCGTSTVSGQGEKLSIHLPISILPCFVPSGVWWSELSPMYPTYTLDRLRSSKSII